MIRIAVVDDQPEAINMIVPIIKECQSDLSVEFEIHAFSDTSEFENTIQTVGYHAMFLDLEMPGKTGFDLSQSLRDKSDDIPIVYITNRDDLMQKAFQYKALGFVRKDKIKEELPFAVSCVVSEIKRKTNSIMIFSANRQKKERHDLLISDILYIESQHHQTKIHVYNRDNNKATVDEIITREPLNFYANHVGFEDFIYISVSCIVNCDHIFSIEKDTLILDNDNTLYISRRKVKEVKDLFLQKSRRLII